MQRQHKVLVAALVTGLGLSVGYCASVDPSAVDDPPPAARQPTSPEATAAAAPEPEPAAPSFAPDALVEPFTPHDHPFLAGEDDASSVSVGTVTTGHLVNGRLLPLPDATYDILPRQVRRGLPWGTDAMIGLIRHAAAAVHDKHKRRLWMGNIGRRGGGDIPWSVSHNSGRDADIAFCYQDAEGEPVDPPDLVHLDEDGVSIEHDGAYRFDVGCTWTLIKGLMTYEEAQVQYLFISNALKRDLLSYARRKGEDAQLVERAEVLLGQPGLSLPHNDHIHVRLYCSKRDVEHGCVNYGRTHPWVDLHEEARAGAVREVSRALGDPEPEQRARAVERLVLLGADARSGDVARLLSDESPRVRAAAAIGLGQMGVDRHAPALVGRFSKEEDPAVKVALLEAATTLGGKKSGELLAQVIGAPAFDAETAGPLPEAIAVAYSEPPPADPRFPEGGEDEPDEPPQDEGEDNPASELDEAVEVPSFTGQVLDLSGRELTVRLAAVEAAAVSERPEPVSALIEALDSDDALLRARAARSLRRLTNHTFEVPWVDPELPQARRSEGLSAWRQWRETYGESGRKVWLAKGFVAHGYDVPKLARKAIWEIVRAITGDDFLSYNAQRTLMRLSNHRPLSLRWPKRDAAWHWTRWFERRRRRFGLGRCPEALSTFNR